MTPMRPKDQFNGVVARALVNKGSKSEHEAIVLKADDGQQITLRIAGINPFMQKELDKFVGCRVQVSGQPISGGLLLASESDITVIGPPGRTARPPKP